MKTDRMIRMILLCVLAVTISGMVMGQDMRTVRATGQATVLGGDIAAAREEAIADAKRTAAEQVNGAFIRSETAVDNFMLTDDAEGASFMVRTLVGDVDFNGSVSGADRSTVKGQILAPLSEANFWMDLNTSGSITGGSPASSPPIMAAPAPAPAMRRPPSRYHFSRDFFFKPRSSSPTSLITVLMISSMEPRC